MSAGRRSAACWTAPAEVGEHDRQEKLRRYCNQPHDREIETRGRCKPIALPEYSSGRSLLSLLRQTTSVSNRYLWAASLRQVHRDRSQSPGPRPSSFAHLIVEFLSSNVWTSQRLQGVQFDRWRIGCTTLYPKRSRNPCRDRSALSAPFPRRARRHRRFSVMIKPIALKVSRLVHRVRQHGPAPPAGIDKSDHQLGQQDDDDDDRNQKPSKRIPGACHVDLMHVALRR